MSFEIPTKLLGGAAIPIAADVILVLFVLYRINAGARRGAVREVSSLASLVISAFGAKLAADSFAPVVAEKYLEERVAAALESARAGIGEGDFFASLPDMLQNAKLPSVIKEDIAKKAAGAMDGGMNALNAAANAAAERLAHALLLALAFVLLYLACSIAFRYILDPLIRSLPIIKGCNALLGALLGGCRGLLLTILAVTLVRFLAPELFAPDGALCAQALEKGYVLKHYFRCLPWLTSGGI